jgi:hypothetical protein
MLHIFQIPPTHPKRNKTHESMSFHLTSPQTPLPLGEGKPSRLDL